jgi:hypothetical protein
VIQTEEATKNAFVMPFISTILGYDDAPLGVKSAFGGLGLLCLAVLR